MPALSQWAISANDQETKKKNAKSCQLNKNNAQHESALKKFHADARRRILFRLSLAVVNVFGLKGSYNFSHTHIGIALQQRLQYKSGKQEQSIRCE